MTRRSSRRSAGCPPRHRKRAARCRLLYWESGVAMATHVEVVDDAVLSGRTRTTNNHAIAATHQAADSNAALPRRERGAANAEAWRGDDVASALARGHGLLGSGGGGIGDGVDADLLRKCCSVGSSCSRRVPGSWAGLAPRRPRPRRRAALSDKGEQSSNRCSPTRSGCVRLLWRLASFCAALPGGSFAQTASRTTKQTVRRSSSLYRHTSLDTPNQTQTLFAIKLVGKNWY